MHVLGEAIVSLSVADRHLGWRQYRTYGASALTFAVATGTFDAFVDIDAAHDVSDYLGALLYCSESGCAVGELNGDELVVLDPMVRRGPIVASTAELHEDIVAALKHS